ncbi:flagellar hook assembly protein FlgD [Thalassotalea litorea]|uniref:flagellar hook assembly protein FlgD n=1 Tax=Thalassotalea litorea TaxID=2020715 RepID=UPI003735B361
MARIEPSFITSITTVIRIGDLLSRILPMPKVEAEDDPLDIKSGVAQMLADTGGRLNNLNHQHMQGCGNALAKFSSSSAALQASALVGRYLLAQQNEVELDDAMDVHGQIELPAKGRHILVYVQNASGDIVKMIPLGDLPKGKALFRWQGDDRFGKPVEPGAYRFIVSSILGQELHALAVSTFQKIIRVATHPESNRLQLVLENNTQVDFSLNLLIRDDSI